MLVMQTLIWQVSGIVTVDAKPKSPNAAIAAADASGMAAMGSVMGQLKPQLAGRADMGAVSQMVKAKLTG